MFVSVQNCYIKLLKLLCLSSAYLRALGHRRGGVAAGDGLLQLLELEPVDIADELEPDDLAGAAQHLDRLDCHSV